MKLESYTEVALTRDLQEYRLRRGDLIKLVEHHVALDGAEGCPSKHDNLIVKFLLKEAGIDKAGILEILEAAGLGLPKYYSWRTRSGCTFCFF